MGNWMKLDKKFMTSEKHQESNLVESKKTGERKEKLQWISKQYKVQQTWVKFCESSSLKWKQRKAEHYLQVYWLESEQPFITT